MFDILDIDLEIDLSLEEVRRDGLTLFGAGSFARAVYFALQSLGVQVRAFVVSGQSTGMIETVPVISLNELDNELCTLPMWLAVFNRNAASDLVMLANICRARGITRLKLPQEYFEIIASQMGWRYWLSDRSQYAAKRQQIEDVFHRLGDDESRNMMAILLCRLLCNFPLRLPTLLNLIQRILESLRIMPRSLVFQ